MERVTRLVYITLPKRKCNNGVAAVKTSGQQHATGILHLIVRAGEIYIKQKTASFRKRSFMERVTRLELATSTLARWRSTG